MTKPLLVLASNSPRRRELLALGGWMFHIRPSEVDESQIPGEAPGTYVLRLAESKARRCAFSASSWLVWLACKASWRLRALRSCAGTAHEDLTILAADTAVVDGTTILGKPKDMPEAAAMLHRLRGHVHQVYTGIAVLRLSDGTMITDLCITDVPMREYSDVEVDAYLATGDPLDKAGAYAIQNAHFHPVESLQGCYASVMGLPLCHLVRTLKKLDITPKNDLPSECQSNLNYACPISPAVLRGETIG